VRPARGPRRKSSWGTAVVSLVLLALAIGGTLWFVQFRARSSAESLHERITQLYAAKSPTCERLGQMFLELVGSPHAAEMLGRLDQEQAGIAYDAGRNAVYFIHVTADARPCFGRAFQRSDVDRGHAHTGFPEFLVFEKVEATSREVALHFSVVKDEVLRASLERYSIEPGASYRTTFEGTSDSFDLVGLTRRAKKK
jgi:hypothetical protein